MEYKDALEYLKILRNLVDITEHDSGAELQRQTYDVAIKAVEKQIPKKPINKEGDSDGSCGYCPNCNHVVDDYFDYKVCQECGQAIDWSDRNE